MQTLGEQMSSVSRAQVQAQLDFFGSLASAAIDGAGRLALLQLNATRDAVDRSGAMWRELFTAGPAALAGFLQRPPRAVDDAGDTASDTPPPAPDLPAAAVEPGSHRTPIAQAAAQVVAPGPGLHPLASPIPAVKKVELPRVKPLEAAPPAPSGTGPRRKAPRK